MTTDNTNITDINDALKGSYLLCTLSVSRWGTSKSDAALAAEVAGNHGASPESVRVAKNIMAGADDELRAVNTALNKIRTYLYSVSLPWSNAGEGAKRGPRLLPTATAMHVMAELSKYQNHFKQCMTDLKVVYDQRVQEALAKQGNLADPSLYPAKEELDQMFHVSFDFSPVPAITDFSRMSLPANVAEALGDRMAKRQSRVIENAMNDVLLRTAKFVSNMASQLGKHASGEKTSLFSSLIGNVQNMAELLAATNITNDPQVVDLANKVRELTEYDIKTLKANISTAQAVARKAEQVVKHPALQGGVAVDAGTAVPAEPDGPQLTESMLDECDVFY